MNQKNPYVEAISKEIVLRKDYLGNETIDTIYFGGGTPSQLDREDLKSILDAVKKQFIINPDAEITLEANPDDLTESYIGMLLDLGFNRLSMGVQSFDNNMLHFLNRRHSAEKAIDAVKTSQQIGFTNISIDLMYGLPNQTMQVWDDTLNQAVDLGIQHISSYHLIYEKGTRLYRLLNIGEVKAIDEDLSLAMFSKMIDRLTEVGFIHYEISSFGKEGCFSRHNTSYWQNVEYLGLGPAAHSYNRINRCWNVSSIPKYIEAIEKQHPLIEEEELDLKTQYNDFVLTRMRTMWGVSVEELCGIDFYDYFAKNIQKHIDSDLVVYDGQTFRLDKNGIFVSDSIMSDLMYLD
jgi:oxygen-independent coproporphyrinogen-3 oxidase